MNKKRFLDLISTLYYPLIVFFCCALFGSVLGIFLGSNVAFQFVNLGLVLGIVTYGVQYYVMPSVLLEMQAEKIEIARLERQENSLDSKLDSLVHDAEQLLHYNAGLKQRMDTWVGAYQLWLVHELKKRELVEKELEKRAAEQTRIRYQRAETYQSWCAALSSAKEDLLQQYTDEVRGKAYIAAIMQGLQDKR